MSSMNGSGSWVVGKVFPVTLEGRNFETNDVTKWRGTIMSLDKLKL